MQTRPAQVQLPQPLPQPLSSTEVEMFNEAMDAHVEHHMKEARARQQRQNLKDHYCAHMEQATAEKFTKEVGRAEEE